MWFLLLTLLETGDYSASSVHATLEDCESSYASEQDVCATVTLQIIELPKTNPITVTVLPSISEMGPAE
jgi:hypothetical protein